MRSSHVLAFASLIAAGLAPSGVSAADPVPGTVTVTAQGSSSGPASLDFTVRVGGKPPAAGGAAPAGPQSLGDLEAGPRTLAASLKAAGATRLAIAFDASLSASNPYPFVVRGELERPSHDRILSLVLSGALATLPDGSPIPIASASGYLATAHCDDLVRDAEAAAFDDAAARARALAARAHRSLGAVRSVAGPAFQPACPAFETATRSTFGEIPLDGPYDVTVTSDVTVTFALR